MTILTGIPLAPGRARGAVLTMRPAAAPRFRPDDGDAQANFTRARLGAAKELRTAIEALPDTGGPARQILQAHLTLISDPALIAAVESRINRDQLTAFEALQQATMALVTQFEALLDPVLRGRARDLRDVCDCIARHLPGTPTDGDIAPRGPRVVCAAELTPAQVLKLALQCPLAFVLEQCAETSHTAILIRALGVPAVVGVPEATAVLRDHDPVIVDGHRGRVIVHPDASAFGSAADTASLAAIESDPRPAVTGDGVIVEVTANIGGLSDAVRAMAAGADGIGLFRTEALFLGRQCVPSEDGQYAEYRDVFTVAGSRPVAVRLLDIGADKEVPALHLPREPNPALGMRGVRLSFVRPDLMMAQLRALMRAADGGRLRLLLPMVVDVSDLERVREMIERAARDAHAAPKVEVGVMIETPAAAVMAEELAAAADFVSVGTNDLTQYVLAADRGNSNLASLYQPLHPAVVRLIRAVVRAATRRPVPVAVCGESAADPRAVPVFVGMGVRELSVHPSAVPRVKAQVRRLSTQGAWALAEEIAGLPTAAAVAARIRVAQEPQADTDVRETGDAR